MIKIIYELQIENNMVYFINGNISNLSRKLNF